VSTQPADETLGAAAAVADFHRAFNLPMRQSPSADVDKSLAKLRVALLHEEVGEFITASEKGDLVAIADALADIAYVVYGTALTVRHRPGFGSARGAQVEHEQARQ
jgi:predicted HAD superfamily Cof-like phosphohydrolase